MDRIKEKFIATFVGCAVGDALGMPIEGWPKKRLEKHSIRVTEMVDPIILKDNNGHDLKEDEFGKIHNWTSVFSKGEYTDDTILTLAIAEAIIEKGYPDMNQIAQNHIQVLDDYDSGIYKGGFGGTTKKAIRKLKNGASPYESGMDKGAGTGPPMKIAPVGLWGTENPNSLEFVAKAIGEMTHKNKNSVAAGIIQASLIRSCVLYENADKAYFLNEALAAAKKYGGELFYAKFLWINNGGLNLSAKDAISALGCGFTSLDCYPLTFWFFLRYLDNPIEGLVQLINCGGDSDTAGAMFGALMGARYGLIFPKYWVDEIQNKDKVIETAKKLYKTVFGD